MRYRDHAFQEFKAAGWLDENGEFKDEMQAQICNSVIDLLHVFAKEGHSGSTAPYAIDMFSKLAGFKLIAPLTGEDDEWSEVSEGVFQNRRCSHVFKQKDRFNGQAYDIEGKVFFEECERDLHPDEPGYPGKDKYKAYYTNRNSFVPVTFPYTPFTIYVEEGVDIEPEEA